MKFLNGQLQLDSSLTGTTALFTSGLTVSTGASSGGITLQQNGILIAELRRVGNNNRSGLFLTNSGTVEIQFDTGSFSYIRSNNFGIGTATDAGYKLDVNGTARTQGTLTVGVAGQGQITAGTLFLQYPATISYTTAYGLAITPTTAGSGYINIDGNSMRFLAANNGISFTQPTGKTFLIKKEQGGSDQVSFLDISGADMVTSGYSTNGGSVRIYGGTTAGAATHGNVILAHDGTSSRGNVGIGTTDLGFKLSVSGSTLLRGSGTTSASYALATQNSSGGTTMVVNNAGNMLIGTTTDAGYKLDVNGTARLNSTTLIEGPLTVNYGGVNGGTSIVANGNTAHNSGRGIYTTGYAYGIQANHTMVGNWSDQPNAAGVHGTGQIGVFGSGDIAGFSGPSAFFTVLNGNGRVSARSHISTFQIRGSGSTELTNTLLLENSSGIKTFTVNDNGNVLIGLSGSTGQKLQVSGTSLFMGVIPFSANNQTIAMVDIQPNFNRASYTGTTALALRVSGGTQIIGSGSTGTTLSVFSVDGSSGRLFDVSDDLSSTLFSVNTIAGLPVIEAFANNAVVMGKYNQNTLVVSGTSVGIGTNATNGKLIVKGSGTTSGSTTVLIQNSATTTSLIINDAGNVGIGTSSPQAKLDVNGTMLLGSLSGDPSGANGMIYYNTTTNKFRGYENGAWGNLIG
jgi:hypothetical protein